jgi:hypothetical protein
MTEHQRFTASSTAYLRSLAPEELAAETFAVHYQDPPRVGDGSTSISLRFPALVVSAYLCEAEAVAEKVARILNAHWDEPEPVDPVEDVRRAALHDQQVANG